MADETPWVPVDDDQGWVPVDQGFVSGNLAKGFQIGKQVVGGIQRFVGDEEGGARRVAEAKARTAELEAASPSMGIDDVTGVGSGLKFIGENVLKAAPLMAATAGGALVGAAAAPALGVGGAGAAALGAAGAFVPSLVTEAGIISSESDVVEGNRGRILKAAAPAALLDSVSTVATLGAGGFIPKAARTAANASRVSRVAKAAGAFAGATAGEAATESAQSPLEAWGAGKDVFKEGVDYEDNIITNTVGALTGGMVGGENFTPEMQEEMRQSFFAGGAAGLGMAGGGKLISTGFKKLTTPKEVEKSVTESVVDPDTPLDTTGDAAMAAMQDRVNPATPSTTMTEAVAAAQESVAQDNDLLSDVLNLRGEEAAAAAEVETPEVVDPETGEVISEQTTPARQWLDALPEPERNKIISKAAEFGSSAEAYIERRFQKAAENNNNEPDNFSLESETKISEKSAEIPSHVVNIVDTPRDVPQAVSLATKQQTKDTLNENLTSGGILQSNPIRMTTVEELHDILTTGKLREGEDFEGRSGISAQVVDGKKPIVAYGPNDKISAAIVFPDGSAFGKGEQPNEVKVDAKTDVKTLRFVVDGYKNLMTFDELQQAIANKPKEPVGAGVILTNSGKPFKSAAAAKSRAPKDGSYDVVQVEGGWAGIPTDTAGIGPQTVESNLVVTEAAPVPKDTPKNAITGAFNIDMLEAVKKGAGSYSDTATAKDRVIDAYLERPDVVAALDAEGLDAEEYLTELADGLIERSKKAVKFSAGGVNSDVSTSERESESGVRGGRDATMGAGGDAGVPSQTAEETVSTPVAGGKPLQKVVVTSKSGVSATATSAAHMGNFKGVSKIAEVFGKTLYVIPKHEGASFGSAFVDPKDPSRVFVREDFSNASLMLLGHELTHTLKMDSPELYAALQKFVDENSDGVKAYNYKAELFKIDDYSKLDSEGLDEERTANLVAGIFSRQSFWEKMAKKEPSLFERVLNVLRDLISKALSVFKGSRIESAAATIKDLKELENVTAKVFAKYARLYSEGRFPVDVSAAGGVKYSLVEKLKPFYSQLESALTKMGGRMPVADLKNMLKKNSVTDAEMDNLIGGLTGTVTKQQVLDEIAANSVEFEDVVLGGVTADNLTEDELDVYAKKLYNQPYSRLNSTEKEKVRDRATPDAPTHFSQYTEPGAKEGSYREMFVTAPDKGVELSPQQRAKNKYGKEVSDLGYEELQAIKLVEWQDGHSQYADVQNPIVRIRFNEREADGKKILFVEEIQGPSDANQQKMPEYLRRRIYDIGVKRVLAYAKENGFDGVSWTTGEMQAKRYDLSKSIDELLVTRNPDGSYALKATLPGGGSHNIGDAVPSDKLEEYVGKNLAQSIHTQETKSEIYNADDLKVGGEGLKRLYDQTLPALFKKYGKGGVGNLYFDGDMGSRLFAEDGSMPFPLEQAVEGGNATSVPFTPITDRTPASYPKYAIADPNLKDRAAAAKAVNEWFQKGTRVLGDLAEGAYRFTGMIDRIITLAASKSEYAPIAPHALKYKDLNQRKAGEIQGVMGEAQKNIDSLGQAFKGKDEMEALSELVFKATLYQLHANPAFVDKSKVSWTDATWKRSGMQKFTGKTLGQAKAELNALYRKTVNTDAKKVAHQEMIDNVTKVYLDGRDAALAPWEAVHGTAAIKKAEAWLGKEKATLAGLEDAEFVKKQAELGKLVPEKYRDVVNAVRNVNERYPMLRGDYMPLMRFGEYSVRVFEHVGGEDGKRLELKMFDSKQEAMDYADLINNNPDSGKRAETATTASIGKGGNVNIPAVLIDKLKAAAEAQFLKQYPNATPEEARQHAETIEGLVQDAEALRINMMPRTVTGAQKLHREGVSGYSTNLMKVYANHIRNNANANAGLKFGSQIEQTFRDMNNAIKVYNSSKSANANTAIDMDKLYKFLYKQNADASKTKINELVQTAGKVSFVWYLSSPSIWAVQWSQPFIVTIPKMATKYGYGTAFKAYTQAAKRYLAGDFSDKRIDEFNRQNEYVGDKIHALMEESRKDGADKATIEKQIKEMLPKDAKQKRLVVLKVLSLQGSIDLSLSHNIQDLAAASNDGDRFADKISRSGSWITQKASTFMRHSETGSRRAAAVSAFELAEKDGFLKAADYATDVINDSLFNMSNTNKAVMLRSNVGHLLGQFQTFRLHMLGKMFQLVHDSFGAEYKKALKAAGNDQAKIAEAKKVRADARKELAYMTGTSLALAGAGGTPVALAFGNTFTSGVLSALSMLFGDDDDPWDLERDFEVGVRDALGDTAGNVVLKGLPSLVGADISRRIGLGGMGDIINGDPPAGLTGTAKANWYAGRLLGPSWGIASDHMRTAEALADGDLAKATMYGSPKVLRDFIKMTEMGEHGVQGGGKTILKAEDVSPYSYGLMMLGVNPLEVSLASEESRYLKNISTSLSQRRSKLISDLATATIENDVDAKDEAIEKINSWSSTNPKLKITQQEVFSKIKKERGMRAGTLTERERLVKEGYGGL